MKTLENHSLIYDNQCPLCAAYTGAFIKTGMLDANGRMVFEKGIDTYKDCLDVQKSKNEIALVNTQTREVSYGIDSLVKVLGYNFPWIEKIAAFKPVKVALQVFYKFISFNRKVIAPSKTYLQQACVPYFNMTYRLVYIILSAAFTSFVLYNYSFLLRGMVPESNTIREFAICFGQLVFQSVLLLSVKAKTQRLFDYLGNMMTVSLIGSLLLLPAFLLRHFIFFSSGYYLMYFAVVVAYMFYLHTKRVQYIGMPWWLSATWVIYRCMVLLIIL